jgi:hypothetical protein
VISRRWPAAEGGLDQHRLGWQKRPNPPCEHLIVACQVAGVLASGAAELSRLPF